MATKDFNTATLTAKYVNLQPANTLTSQLYAVPTGACFKVASLTLSNTHTASITANVWLVPSGGSAANDNKIVSSVTLGTGETLSLNAVLAGAMLSEGTSLRIQSSVGAVLTAFLTGVEGV